jgi:hypothetical protein
MDDGKGEERENSEEKKGNSINSNEVTDMTTTNLLGGIPERKYVELTSEEIHALNGVLAGLDSFDISVDGLGIELVGNTFYIHLIGVNRV